MPFEGDERIAFEELVRIELSDRGSRLEEDKMGWLTEALAHPAIRI